MGPGLKNLDDRYENKKPGDPRKQRPLFHGFRRLSHIKSRNFCTWNNAYQGSLVHTTDSGITLPTQLRYIPDLASAFSPFRQ
mmetsp:Transcript_4401/g.5877  ORF Transcript_4401/g.5877 Transcript_4401/m.5877 type:complete len:82 (+) Transcript_4401:2469-2714(+)